MPFITEDDSLGKALMLTSTERMTQFLSIMRRFHMLTWEQVEDLITVGVWNTTKQEGLLNLLAEERVKPTVTSPSMIPSLVRQLRVHIPASFHIADKVGGVTGIGSMVFEPEIGSRQWALYDRNAPSVLTWNFREGQFGRIGGVPGSGKTSLGCVLIEEWIAEDETNVAFTNIFPDGGEYDDPRIIYVRDSKSLFDGIANLSPDAKWLFVLDEAGLMYSKPDQATRRVKDLDKLMRVVRKLHGSIVLIEQRPESIPNIIQDFATCIFFCLRPGIVHIELKGPHIMFKDTVKDFPKTKLPFKTYDIAFFSVNVNIISMFAAMSGADDPRVAMTEWMGLADPTGDISVEQEAEQEMKLIAGDGNRSCLRCGKPLTEKQIIHYAKYCSKSCSTMASVERTAARRQEAELEEHTPVEVLNDGGEIDGTPSPNPRHK